MGRIPYRDQIKRKVSQQGTAMDCIIGKMPMLGECFAVQGHRERAAAPQAREGFGIAEHLQELLRGAAAAKKSRVLGHRKQEPVVYYTSMAAIRCKPQLGFGGTVYYSCRGII